MPTRFSATASAIRYRAAVVAEALMECVYAAGGEPLGVFPGPESASPDEIAGRISWADGVLLPGGGDLAPHWSGQGTHPALYDVDLRQDAFDLGLARLLLASTTPLLAICRGAQVVNVALGGDLVQDMEQTVGHHRHRRHQVAAVGGSVLADLTAPELAVSCYHHQCLGRLGNGLVITGTAADGVVEAVELSGRPAWFLGTQWHPEDTALDDPVQLALFAGFIAAAAAPRS